MIKLFVSYVFIPLMGICAFIQSTSVHALPRGLKLATPKSSSKSLEDSFNYGDITDYFEEKYTIPKGLLTAIAMVESRKSPWAINAVGQSNIFKTKSHAKLRIMSLKKQGIKNINIGFMQINLAFHEKSFKSIDVALTPYHNIGYAAQYLKKLYLKHGSWERAVRYYHSGSNFYNIPYRDRVFNAWKGVLNKNIPLDFSKPTLKIASHKKSS